RSTSGSSMSYPLIGNFSKGVTSDSENVGARWPLRKSLAEAQSLKPRAALSNGACSLGIANAPRATTGVSFSNSRRVTLLHLRASIRELIRTSRYKPTLRNQNFEI